MERIVFPNSVEPVLEQDFIMLLRRLYRDGGDYLVTCLELSRLPAVGREHRLIDVLHEKFRFIGQTNVMSFYPMTNGDVFVVQSMPKNGGRDAANNLFARLNLDVIEPSLTDPKYTQSFIMPADYSPLRERVNFYVDFVRTASAKSELTAEQILQSEGVQGPLTAWSIAQMQRLFDEIDLVPYLKEQRVYHYPASGEVKIIYHDFYLSLSDLQRTRFPKLDLREPARLLMELRHSLDTRVLGEFVRQFDLWRRRPVFLNLSVDTAMAAPFTQFCRAIQTAADRSIIGFEIHRSDLLLDFSMTKNTLANLHSEGFRTGLDAITPDCLTFLKLDTLPCDQIKIFVDRSNLHMLQDAEILRAIKNLPAEKIVFARCDTEAAWQMGRKLGVTHFHGWYLDDTAGPEKL